MDDVTAVAAGDAQVFAGARQGMALVAALLEADRERMAVVPAARALVQVASKGARVADLRRGQSGGRLLESGVIRANGRVFGHLGNGGHGSDGQPLTGI